MWEFKFSPIHRFKSGILNQHKYPQLANAKQYVIQYLKGGVKEQKKKKKKESTNNNKNNKLKKGGNFKKFNEPCVAFIVKYIET